MGYSLIKTLVSLKIYTKTPNTWNFRHKNSQLERFLCRIHRKLGIFDEIFPKSWEIPIIWYKINHKSNNLGRKLRKIGFFTKTGTNFPHITSTTNFVWVHINTIAKNNCFPHKPRWKYPPNQILQNIHKIIVENTKNLPNSSICTIELQHSEKLSHIISKLAFSQSATTIVLQTSVNCSHTELSKQQLTAHTSIVKIIWQSVTNTHCSLQTHYSCHWC